MKRKYAVLVLTLVCLLLAACAIQDTDVAATATPAATRAATQAATAGPTQSAGEERPALLTNDNVTLPGELPVCEQTETLSIGMAQNNNVISYAYEDNYQTKWMQDRSNVKIDLQLFPATDANQKMELLITSNSPLPDIIIRMGVENDSVRYRYGKAGALIPLNDYYEQLSFFFDQAITEYEGDPDYMSREELFNYTLSPDGNLYGAVCYFYTLPDSYCNRAWINQKWLDNLSLAVPETSEELVNVLKAFRDSDPNGNGEQDEIPMVGANGGWNTNPIEWVMDQFIYCSSVGTGYYSTLSGGKIDASFDKEEWREGLRMAKSLVDEGLLSTLSFTQDGAQYNALVSAETQVVGIGVSGSISGFSVNKADYTPMGAVLGPDGAQWATFTPQTPFVNAAVTRDCESVDLAFRWLEMGYLNEYAMIPRFGETDVDWEYADTGSSLYADLGYGPFYKVINNIWGTSQQKMWINNPLPVILTSRVYQGEVWNGDTSNNEYKNSLAVNKLFDYTPDKEDIIFKIIYTEEEIEEYSELRTTLVSYIKESMVRFVMGDLDLDSDWDTYLSELEKLDYQDLIAVDQTAYDRTVGK